MAWAPVFPALAITFSRLEYYWLLYLTVAWILAWGTYGIAYLLRPGLRAAPWPWSRLVGVTLVLWPFVQYAYGIYLDFALLIQTDDVAPTVPAWVWWLAVRRRNWQLVLLPLFGMYLALGMPRRADLHRVGDRVRATLQAVWLWPRRNATRSIVDGLGLFVLVFFGYVFLNNLLSPLRQYDGGDESNVFAALTPALAFALALTAGLTEEVMFRGVLQTRLNLVMPVWASISIQAVFFALIHAGYGTISHVLAPLAFGLMMGLIAQWLGLIPAIIIHALLDLVIFLYTVAANGYEWTVVLVPFLFFAGVALPVVYYAMVFFQRWKERRAQRGY